MKQLYLKRFDGNQYNQSYRTVKTYLISDIDVINFNKLYNSGQNEYENIIGNRLFKNVFRCEYYYISDIPKKEVMLIVNELVGNLETIYQALKDLNITPIIAEYDYVLISEEDYHIHKNELARRGII